MDLNSKPGHWSLDRNASHIFSTKIEGYYYVTTCNFKLDKYIFVNLQFHDIIPPKNIGPQPQPTRYCYCGVLVSRFTRVGVAVPTQKRFWQTVFIQLAFSRCKATESSPLLTHGYGEMRWTHQFLNEYIVLGYNLNSRR